MIGVFRKFFSSAQYEAPTMRSEDVLDGGEYRLQNDPPSVIRINQRCPFPDGIIYNQYVSVLGVSRSEKKQTVESFMKGSNRGIELVPESSEESDLPSIKVIGTWENGKERHEGVLGYLPKRVTKDLQNSPHYKATVSKLFVPYRDNSPGIRLCIWTAKSQN